MGWWWWHSLHFAVLVGDRVVFSGSRWNRLCRLLRFTSDFLHVFRAFGTIPNKSGIVDVLISDGWFMTFLMIQAVTILTFD